MPDDTRHHLARIARMLARGHVGKAVAAAEHASARGIGVRLALATLYLRLCPREEVWKTLREVPTETMPVPDAMAVTAFAHGVGGDRAQSLRLFHGVLAREPYHPIALYDLACVLARQGATETAAAVLLDAVRNGQSRLGARFPHDPDLISLTDQVDPVRRGLHGADKFAAAHEMLLFQVRPSYRPYAVRLELRPGACDQAAAEQERFGENVGLLLRYDPRPALSGRTSSGAGFELSMPADRLSFRGWDLHCALRRIAPLVEDGQWFLHGWHGLSHYLDEFAVRDGELHILRVPMYGGAGEYQAILQERVRCAPDDSPLAQAVMRQFGPDRC
ncbi:hypothetical protein [Planobispora takensis]|uniref:Tetratricopeptide repeat protein n=1 Tax=Planobispora takensis TaxID=1367882 RepID=A0A8J3WY91_9ACTN|nr:hypothetical protein [Planobispora takensis]GII03592.1 hypothetical protein Pta02_56000 [Planobispora takensis]